MAADMVAFLESVVGGAARLVGYSAGAVVALLVAVRRPDLVRQLVLVSGGFHRDGWLLPPPSPGDVPQIIYDLHGEVSPDGAAHLAVVIDKIAASSSVEPDLTAADLTAIACRTLVLVGDDDAVSAEHSLAMFRALPAGELAVIPGASHCALQEKPALCTWLITDFLTTEQATTWMPIRRAP
jgi:pimeloyl-ACP methyl ester carboxylesterase